jgi:hypothetical protein
MRNKRRSAPKPQPAREIVVDAGQDYRILYDRETRDFAVEFKGAPVGWRATEAEARRLIETLRYEDARRGTETND